MAMRRPYDYQPGRGGIAVFGDSYVEALMNDYADTLQGSLNEYLKTPRKVHELRHVRRRDARLSRHRARWCATDLRRSGPWS